MWIAIWQSNGGGWTRTNERYTRAVLQTAAIATRLHRQNEYQRTIAKGIRC